MLQATKVGDHHNDDGHYDDLDSGTDFFTLGHGD